MTDTLPLTGATITRLREASGLTRTRFAATIGKSYRTLARWEAEPNADVACDRPTQIVLEMLDRGELPERYLQDDAA